MTMSNILLKAFMMDKSDKEKQLCRETRERNFLVKPDTYSFPSKYDIFSASFKHIYLRCNGFLLVGLGHIFCFTS